MVTFDELYIFDYVSKLFSIWFIVGIAIIGLLYAIKKQNKFLYFTVFTLIYLCSSLIYFYGQKLYVEAFVEKQKEILVNAKLAQARYELYDQSGDLIRRTHSLSASEIINTATIFSKIELRKRPNLGIPSIDHRIKLFCGSEYELLFTIYNKNIIMIGKHTFELNNAELWDFLISSTPGAKDNDKD